LLFLLFRSVQSASIIDGNTYLLSPTISPSNATNKDVSYSSSNNSIATVSSSGLITGITPGEATITVTTASNNKTATFTIRVTAVAVLAVAISFPASTLQMGKTLTLGFSIAPSIASNKSVTWSSSNTSIATVSSTGVVTPVSRGRVVITVKTVDGLKTNNLQLEILPLSISLVSVNHSTLNLVKGSSANLNATFSPSTASNDLVWESLTTSVATVDQNGKVTSNSTGTAIIQVS
jgi:uncharacterized protein YjdB